MLRRPVTQVVLTLCQYSSVVSLGKYFAQPKVLIWIRSANALSYWQADHLRHSLISIRNAAPVSHEHRGRVFPNIQTSTRLLPRLNDAARAICSCRFRASSPSGTTSWKLFKITTEAVKPNLSAIYTDGFDLPSTYDHRTLRTSSPARLAVCQGTVLRFLCRVYRLREPVVKVVL